VLRRWHKELGQSSQNAYPGNGTPRDQELARLKRELHQVKQERDFLKEAAAYFAKTCASISRSSCDQFSISALLHWNDSLNRL
jgi:transposase